MAGASTTSPARARTTLMCTRRSLIPTIAAVAGVLVTAYLGSWQLDRAAYKRELQERYDEAARQPAVRVPAATVDTAALAWRRVEAVGRFKPEMTVLLDNRMHEGVVGYEVLTPLQLENSARVVLVKRGWVKAPPVRTQLPAVATPAATLTVRGIALPPTTRFVELSERTESGPVWQNLKFERFAAQYRVELQPILLQQDNDTGDGLLRAWQPPATGVDRHQAYALQWFAMSGCIVVIYVVLQFRARQKAQRAL